MYEFSGPLFLIGMPRSGTKLLRGLLTRHPNIGIPHIETDFLQSWIANWESHGDLSKRENFSIFYQKQLSLTYFIDFAENSQCIDEETWYARCNDFSIASVFEALIRHDAISPRGAIYGDKSPSYINCLSLIKKVFSEALFIHIVRDARDYALSVHSTWGKNMYRASQRWADCLRGVQEFKQLFPNVILEIRYEDLLEDTQTILKKCCHFLSIDFQDCMLEMQQNYEPAGRISNSTRVVKSNKAKYISIMPKRCANKIEQITGDMLKLYNYTCSYKRHTKRIGFLSNFYMCVSDAISMIRYESKKRGVKKAILYHLNHYLAIHK